MRKDLIELFTVGISMFAKAGGMAFLPWIDPSVRDNDPDECLPFNMDDLERDGGYNLDRKWVQVNYLEKVQLHYRKVWKKADEPKAILIFLNGYAMSGDVLGNFSKAMMDKVPGLVIYSVDLFCHGYSSVFESGKVAGRDYVTFVHEIFKKACSEHPELPVFMGGRSTGATASMAYGGFFNTDPLVKDRLKGVAVQSLFFYENSRNLQGYILQKLAETFNLLDKSVPFAVDPQRFSGSLDFIYRYLKDPSTTIAPTLGMFLSFETEIGKLANLDEKWLNPVPVLMQHGTDDVMCPEHSALSLFKNVVPPDPDNVFISYSGMRHALLGESYDGRSQIASDMGGWMNRVIDGVG